MSKILIFLIPLGIMCIAGILAEVGLVYRINPTFAIPFIAALLVMFGIMRKTDQKS
jgi:hypothetical protein